jgi:hypothetical protein
MARCRLDQRRPRVPPRAEGPTRAGGAAGGVRCSADVKAYAVLAGLDPAQFSGNSLRSGFLTSAAEAGASVFKMMEVSRHRPVDVLRGYVRRADLFHEHAGAAFL